MKKMKIKKDVSLHPAMAILILCLVVIVLSGVLNLFNVHSTVKEISLKTGEYQITTEAVNSLMSLSGLKYIFTNTVSNFANFVVLPHLIILLFGIGMIEKSGFLKTLVTLVTKKAKKTTVTFLLVLVCILASIMGDFCYILFIPLGALLFLYGKRSPIIGITAAFAGLSCGSGISLFLTSVDSSLISTTVLNAHVLQSTYEISPFAFIFISLIVIIALAFLITYITENVIAKMVPKYEFEESELENDLVLTKSKKRGLLLAGIAGTIYLIIFIYNIIPGLPFSGALLDNSQVLYIDKLFSYNSFFSNGFVFIVTVFFIILGLFYGIGARTIKNNKDVIDALGSSFTHIGRTLLIIFTAATFISIFKQSNIGNVIVAALANLIGNSGFTGLPLILLLFFASVIATMFLPVPVNKWPIIASTAIPAVMNAGISPEFAQIVSRFGGCVTAGLTPVFSYFIVYLVLLEQYNKDNKSFKLSTAIKYQIPYSIMSMVVFIAIIIIWYIIGLPIGVGAGVAL